ncbi:MAG: DUF2993 domain-containing protein [Acetomicrobium sp.]
MKLKKKTISSIFRSFLKICLACSIITLILPFNRAYGSSVEKLATAFTKELTPEQAIIIVDNPPKDDGYVGHLYVNLKGAVLEGLRIDEISLEAKDVYFNPPAKWDEKLRPQKVAEVSFEARLLEDDINKALKEYELKDKKWSNFKFDLRDGQIVAIAVYEQPLLLFKLNVLVKLSGKLEVVDKDKIYLVDYKLYADGFRLPEQATRDLVENVQPLLDFSEFMFPVKLDSVYNDEEALFIRTKEKPEPFDSAHQWTYSLASESVVSR